MKPDNYKNTINSRSKEFSRLTNLPFTDSPFASSSNYINKDNISPPVGSAIHVSDIVFSKEELADNKWLLLSPPNKEFKDDVVKILNNWRRNSRWIIIQSEEFIKEDREKRKNKIKEDDKIHKYNMDHTTFKCPDPSIIDLTFIRAKYYSIGDFKNSHPEYDGELTNKFQVGDDIWHYDETISTVAFGTFDELFLLIRNNKIVYSPWVGGVMRDDWGNDKIGRVVGFKLGDKTVNIRVNEKTGNINVEI